MDDELQEVRDNFYVGNFAKALQLCESTTASNDYCQNELDATLARCFLSIPILDRLRQMTTSEVPGQKAAALMAPILKAKSEEQKSKAKEKLSQLSKQTQDMNVAMFEAIVLSMDGSYNEAVQTARAHPTLEMQSLSVFVCLLCHQVATAEKVLKDMSGNNDDSAAFRLASAAVKLATGDAEEAYLIYCDLSSQFPVVEGDEGHGSVLLQTGKGVASMMPGMYAEALEELQRALALAPADVDVLVNLCCCTTHLRKQDDFAQYFAKLEQACPTHPYVVKTQSIQNVFVRFKNSLQG